MSAAKILKRYALITVDHGAAGRSVAPVFACIQVLVKHLVDQRLRRRNMPTEAYHYVDRDQPPKPPAPSA